MTQKAEIINRHLKKGWVGESGLIEMISECMEDYAALHTPTEEELRKEAEALYPYTGLSDINTQERIRQAKIEGYIAGKASQNNKTNT